MKIAVVFPPFHHRKFSENLKVIDEEFVLAPPIILAYVTAIMEKSGHEVILIDAHALNLSKEQVLQRIKMFNSDLLAFRLDTYNFQETLEWIRYLKINTGLSTLVGGINMSLYPYETLKHREIDYGMIGEAIESLPQFLEAFENSKSYKHIQGLCWRDTDGRVYANFPSKKLVNFDRYPFPSRHLLPNEIYHSFVSQRKNFTVMLTSTGCPYRCSFCAIAALNHYRERSWKSVIKEIEECYYDYGIREIDFFDATFFINKQKNLKLFQEIRKRGLKINWTCRTRVDVVDKEILKEASRAGCRMIFWGIESNSQEVLDGINKGIKQNQTISAIKTSKKFGISNLGFLMVGNPGESEETVKNTVKFAKDLELDYVQICRTIAKPGTELHKKLIKETGYDYWKEFVSCKVDEMRIPAPWVKMTQEKVEILLRRAYYSFYFRPKYIIHTILNTKSIRELLRYIKVGIRMITHYFYTDVSIAKSSKLIKRIAHWELKPSRKTVSNISKTAVVIPVCNERKNILGLLKKIIALYPSMKIFVVDSESTDGTGETVKRFSVMYPQVNLIKTEKRNRGNERGMAIKKGFCTALSKGAEVIVEMDADFSHDPKEISEFLSCIKSFDMVIGSRYVTGGSEAGRSILRRIASRLANSYIRKMLHIKKINDCTSGYRCYKKRALESIDIESIKSKEGTAALIETVYRAKEKGLKIKEIPIIYRNRKYGYSKIDLNTIFRNLDVVTELATRSGGTRDRTAKLM